MRLLQFADGLLVLSGEGRDLPGVGFSIGPNRVVMLGRELVDGGLVRLGERSGRRVNLGRVPVRQRGEFSRMCSGLRCERSLVLCPNRGNGLVVLRGEVGGRGGVVVLELRDRSVVLLPRPRERLGLSAYDLGECPIVLVPRGGMARIAGRQRVGVVRLALLDRGLEVALALLQHVRVLVVELLDELTKRALGLADEGGAFELVASGELGELVRLALERAVGLGRLSGERGGVVDGGEA